MSTSADLPPSAGWRSSVRASIGEFRRLASIPWIWEARLRGVQIEGKVEFLGRPIITVEPGSQLILRGENVLGSSRRCSDLANFQPCVLRTLTSTARLELGKGVGLSGAAICAAASVTVGEGTIVGVGACIFDTDFHQPAGEIGWINDAAVGARPISIGRGCFIGARAIIMKGVKIGDRAAVGAGAVVACHVPSGTIAMGNPARIWPWNAVARPGA